MLNHADETDRAHRPDIGGLLGKLVHDGKRWAEAEVAMARIEIDEFKRKAVRAILFLAVGFAAFFCLLVALMQACIAFLAAYIGNAALAALIVAAALVVFVAMSFAGLRSALSWNAESMLLGWLAGRPGTVSRRP